MVFGLISIFNFWNRTFVVPVSVLGANRTKPHHAHPYVLMLDLAGNYNIALTNLIFFLDSASLGQ